MHRDQKKEALTIVNLFKSKMETAIKRERKAVQNTMEIDEAVGGTGRLSESETIIRGTRRMPSHVGLCRPVPHPLQYIILRLYY